MSISPDVISRRKYCIEKALEFTKDAHTIKSGDLITIAKEIENYIWENNENRN